VLLFSFTLFRIARDKAQLLQCSSRAFFAHQKCSALAVAFCRRRRGHGRTTANHVHHYLVRRQKQSLLLPSLRSSRTLHAARLTHLSEPEPEFWKCRFVFIWIGSGKVQTCSWSQSSSTFWLGSMMPNE
jgi:hypothetical protein